MANTPADARLAIYLLEILAGEAVNYRNNPDFHSRAEKAWYRLTREDCVRMDARQGVWHVKSTRREVGWHIVEPASLSCDCEDSLHKTRPICHHIIIAALAEAGRRDAARLKREAINEWERVKAAGGLDEPRRRWPSLREHLTERKLAAREAHADYLVNQAVVQDGIAALYGD